MTLTGSQIRLLSYQASGFRTQFARGKLCEHGSLPPDVDICLALGLCRYGHNKDLFEGLSTSTFEAFNRCLPICLQDGDEVNSCEICGSIADLAQHAKACEMHPEVCQVCGSLYKVLEFHLLECKVCDMHLCTKLKLKMMRNRLNMQDGLTRFWPKLQQYLSQLFPAAVDIRPVTKPGLFRFPSLFDYSSGSATPNSVPSSPMTPMMCRPMVLSRGVDSDGSGGELDVSQPYYYPGPECYIKRLTEMDLADPSTGIHGIPLEYPDPYEHSTLTGRDLLSSPANIGLTDHTAIGPAAVGPQAHANFTQPLPAGLSNNFLSMLTSMTEPEKPGESDGCGAVIHGEPRQLRQLAKYWMELKEQLKGANGVKDLSTEYDGVLLDGKESGMKCVDNMYVKEDHWDTLTELGSGRFGTCFLAADRQTQAVFAAKKIDLLKYEADEIILWSELEHPNLVQLYGATRYKHKIWIFSEVYTAGNLAELIHRNKALDQWTSLYFLQQLFDALCYLKNKEVLHEDIKADNIFLKPDSFKIGLGDFGLSRKGVCPPDTHPVGGQPSWSPEKAMSKGYGPLSDLWAANCTFVHMLSGSPPWIKRFNQVGFLHYIISTKSPPVEDIPEGLIPLVDEVIKLAWTVDTRSRPAAADLLQHPSFQLLQFDRADMRFRSHLGSLSFDTNEPMDLTDSVDELLKSLSDEEKRYVEEMMSPTGSAASQLRRQFSVKQPTMESIYEEREEQFEMGVSGTDRTLLDRRSQPSLPSLIIKSPSSSSLSEKRSSLTRSNTTPTSSEDDRGLSLSSLGRRESSPAIFTSSQTSELIGTKSIFELSPDTDLPPLSTCPTSGYVSGSANDDSITLDVYSLNSQLHSGFTPQAAELDSRTLDEQLNRGDSIYCTAMDDWGMSEDACFMTPPDIKPSEISWKYESSQQTIQICVYNCFDCPPSENKIEADKDQTWLDVISKEGRKLKSLGGQRCTFFDQIGQELNLDAAVSTDKCVVLIQPTRSGCTWHMVNEEIIRAFPVS